MRGSSYLSLPEVRAHLQSRAEETRAQLQCRAEKTMEAVQVAAKVTSGVVATGTALGAHRVPAVILFAGVARMAVDTEELADRGWYISVPPLASEETLGCGWVAVVAVIISILAILESLRQPRFVGHHNFIAICRTALQLLGDVLLVPYYTWQGPEEPELGFQPTAINQQLLAACPSLKSYFCTPWLRHTYTAFSWYTLLELLPLPNRPEHRLRRQAITMPDGGTVCLDWVEDDMPDEEVTKVLFIASTWAGDSLTFQARKIAGRFVEDGWRVVTMVKRGCGLRMANPLTSERTFTLDIDEDLLTCIDVVARACPRAFLAGVGVSKGAMELRSYAARMGRASKLSAVVAIDAGLCWNECCENVDERLPVFSKMLTEAVLEPCRDYQRKHGSQKFGNLDGVLTSRDFFRDCVIPSRELKMEVEPYMYGATVDPVGVAVPCLEVLSYNDTLIPASCVADASRMHQVNRNIINLTTRGGTHGLRFSGWDGECWLPSCTLEFLRAAYKLRQ